MTNNTFSSHCFSIFVRLVIVILIITWPSSTHAQEFFEFEEDTLRMQVDCPDLTPDEAEYIFLIDRPDLAISGTYHCDSVAPSFQYIENEYQYLIRLRQLRHEKKRSLRFALQGTTYTSEFKLSARRQSRHFIRIIPRNNFIRLTEVGDGYSIQAGDKNAVKVIFRTSLDLSIESPDVKAQINYVRSNVNLNEYTVIVNNKDIDPEGSYLYITSLDGSSNTISVNLAVVAKIKSEKTYEISLAEYQSAGKPVSRNLNFQVQPANAPYIVYLDGAQLDVGVNSRFLFLGRHDIRVEAPNYHVLDTFIVMDDPVNDKHVTLSLRPRYGSIRVDSPQIKGSTVILDGVEVGNTPLTIQPISSGRHYLEVEERSYITYQAIVDVADKQSVSITPHFVKRTKPITNPSLFPVNIRVTPAKIHPYVVIRTSENDSVIVEINKKGEGLTHLIPGTYRYYISAPNYHSISGTFIVNTEAPSPLIANLKPHFGKIAFESKTLRGATVSIDGNPSGRVPCTVNNVPSGIHYVQITPREGLTLRKRIEVNDGVVTQVDDIKHIKNYVRLGFNAQEGDTILINGVARGLGHLDSQPFKNSPVRITCRHEGYFDTTILIHFQLGDKDSIISLPPLRAKKGYLVASSIPSDAGIYIDNRLIGKTPVSNLQVPVGVHKLSFNKAGYQGVDTIVTFNYEKPFIIQDVRLQKERRTLNRKTLILVSCIPSSYIAQRYYSSDLMYNIPVVGLTIGNMKRFGWYLSAFSNFKFDNPSAAIDYRGCTDNGSFALFDNRLASSLTYLSGTVGVNLRIIRPIWIYIGGGYAIKNVTVHDAQGHQYYIHDYSKRGICAEAGIGLAIGPIAFTGGINIIDPMRYRVSIFTYRLGVGFAL